MDMNNVKTMTGLTMAEAAAKLDEQLPAEAYTAVPGGADLTDIDPNYMRKVLNEVFGLCGLGWGYEYDPADMETRNETRKTQSGTREVVVAALKHLRFWYKVTGGKEASICTVDASGGSDNSSASYAMKGAITNALGNAASNIGFQESVYLGKRSHKTVRASAPGNKPAAKSVPAPVKPATAASKPAPSGASVDGEIADAAEGFKVEAMTLDTVLNFVVPTGAWKDKTFKDVVSAGESGQKAIDFWTRMNPGADLDKQALKAIALRYVELAKSNHTIPEDDKVAEPA